MRTTIDLPDDLHQAVVSIAAHSRRSMNQPDRRTAIARLDGLDTARRYCAPMHIDISTLDEAQLVDLNRRIVARLKCLQEARTHHQMLSFDVGDRVRLQPPGHDPKTGAVVRHNRKTVTVVTDDHHQWNVAPVFLSRAVETAPEPRQAPGHVVKLPIKR